MVKKYDKDLLEDNIIDFDTHLHSLNDEKSVATISIPFPALKALKISKDSSLHCRIILK